MRIPMISPDRRADSDELAAAVPREAVMSDLAGLAALLATNECLINIGRQQGRPELVQIGTAYVNHVLATELSSWTECSKRYASPGSRLWVLCRSDRVVVGSIGVIEISSSTFELVRMYVDASCRRCGLGRRLFGVLLDHVRSRNAHAYITLTTPSVNTGPQAFYRSLGFLAKRSFLVSEEGWDSELEVTEMRMELPITTVTPQPPGIESDGRAADDMPDQDITSNAN